MARNSAVRVGPHAGQAADEGRVRVPLEHLSDVFVDQCELVAGGEHLAGQAPDQLGGDLLAGHGDLLGVRRLERVVGDRGDDRVPPRHRPDE
jgi:hypothetical protein